MRPKFSYTICRALGLRTICKNSITMLCAMQLATLASAQIPHDPLLEQVDHQAIQQIAVELTKPVQFDRETQHLIGRALKSDADLTTVYEAILYKDAQAWASGKLSAAGSSDAIKLNIALLKFKQPESFEIVKAELLSRRIAWSETNEWKKLKAIGNQAPDDQFLHYSYLIGLSGYGKPDGSDYGYVISECGTAFAKQPGMLGLRLLKGIASIAYANTHPKEKKMYLQNALSDLKFYIAQRHLDKASHPIEYRWVERTEKQLKNL